MTITNRTRRGALLTAALRASTLICALGALAVAQDPEPSEPETPQVDVSALRRDAVLAVRDGRHEQAAELYRQLMSAQPSDPQWVVHAADAMGRYGAVNDALDLLDIAKDRFPDVADVPAMMAKIFHLKADRLRQSGVFDANVTFLYEDARRTAERVVEMQPGHVEARLLIASASFQLGDNERALTEALRVATDRPDEYGGHAMVGRVRFQQFVEAKQAGEEERAAGLLSDATESLSAARRADPERSFPIVKLGDLAAWSGDLDTALGLYGDALGVDPNSQVSHSWIRGAVEAEKRRSLYGEARRSYASSAAPSEQGLGLLRWYESQAAFDASDWSAAAEGFREALERMPEYDDTYWWLMQSLFWGGDSEGAETVAVEFARSAPRRFADMVRADDQTVSTIVGMARQAYQGGRVADSRELNRVIAYARRTGDAWNNYAFLCRETQRYEESAKAYEEALQIEPDSPQLLNDAGVIYEYHLRSPENLQRARGYYERAIRLAEEQIASGGLDADALGSTRIALRDARNNLRRM